MCYKNMKRKQEAAELANTFQRCYIEHRFFLASGGERQGKADLQRFSCLSESVWKFDLREVWI